MIMIKNGQMQNEFVASFKTIHEAKGLPTKSAYWIGRIGKKLDTLIQDNRKFVLGLMEKHKAMENPQAPPSQDFVKEMNEFMEIEHKIDFPKIPLSTLEGAGLSASDLHHLDPVLDVDFPEEKLGKLMALEGGKNGEEENVQESST